MTYDLLLICEIHTRVVEDRGLACDELLNFACSLHKVSSFI